MQRLNPTTPPGGTASRHRTIASGALAVMTVAALWAAVLPNTIAADDGLTADELAAIRAVERARIETIQKVFHSVVAIYGDDRQGGGSGVVIDPSGLALTNHHVIQGAGVSGWGGLADGKLYRWRLIGTDPGGDVAIIQLEGKDQFDYAAIGDSELVRVGDWSLAMGNPFILAEDQTPTVTLGIVSGVKRYQYGSGNELVYGNCIQTDSSINPGNSGGPLFNMSGEIIGINGRGSFEERGRVNVGLGYAISSNQIRNFVPDLLATKVVEHATLDAQFGNRSGGVLCQTINLDAPVADAGLELGDRLLEFEGYPITSANQFTNLICTLPERWPAELTIQKEDGRVLTLWVRMLGLPYTPPPPMEAPPEEDDEEPNPDQERAQENQRALQEWLSAPPGTILDYELNRRNVERLVGHWQRNTIRLEDSSVAGFRIVDRLVAREGAIGRQEILLARDGRFRLKIDRRGVRLDYLFDGQEVWDLNGATPRRMRRTEFLADADLVQVLMLSTLTGDHPLSEFGNLQLDGSDKAQRQTSHRLKVIDENGNWFYCWLSMASGLSRDTIRVLKASIDMDGNDGAVTFHDWAWHDGLCWPQTRRFVTGLAESEQMRAENESIESLDVLDESILSTAETTGAPQPEPSAP